MEYVFGNDGKNETLRTKNSEHSELSGFVTVRREYPDQTITDSFFVVEKTKTDEDCEGNCYDWYVIDKHNRIIDKSPAMEKLVEKTNADVMYLSMMTGVDIPSEEDTENE